MIAHGFVTRATKDIDLFTRDAERPPADHRFVAIDPASGAECTVEIFPNGGRLKPTVIVEIGPVPHPDDLAADKVLALWGRARPRDFFEVAALIERYGTDRLLILAAAKDAGFSNETFVDALRAMARLGPADWAEDGIDVDRVDQLDSLVLLGATGIEPKPPLEIADPAKIGPVRTGELAFHNPALRVDLAALTDEQRAVMAANQAVQALIAPGSYDPKLRGRLHRVGLPVLVLGGEQDGIVPLDYERDLADSFPHSTFRAIPDAAHFPHIEQPELVQAAIGEFRATRITAGGIKAGGIKAGAVR